MNKTRTILRASRPRTGMAAAFVAIAAGAAPTAVTVSDVTFTQDAASHDVTVTYDLDTLDGEPAFVSLDVLTNGVSVGATRVKSVIGDVSTTPADTASLVAPGTGKSIIWHPRADMTGAALENVTVRVAALATNHFEGLYLVVDLEKGAEASFWPVRYTACKPDLASPLFYTTELWLRRVPAATFKMGYSGLTDASPVHNVTLSRDFYCAVVPTTRAQHALVTGKWPNGEDASMGRYPVTMVSYNGIRGQNWPNNNLTQSGQPVTLLRAKTQLQFDIPTEAQWEYACRAGHEGNELNDGTPYEGTDKNIKPGVGYYDLGWGQANSGYSSASQDNHWQPVALKKASDWDFYDFYGNVLEWCRDWYGAYSGDDTTDPPGASGAKYRVSRGGSFRLNASTLNSFFRRHVDATNIPTQSNNQTGYRLVVETDEGNASAPATGANRDAAGSTAAALELAFGSTAYGRRAGAGEHSVIDTLTPISFVLILR
ncbi:MAG: SUMF1/EgtB/PvdO family nonheme iron enzyme [Kiritimatiellae bacterium]|nr:SUMF1/EgtB/PvdO family nonheme iron enzyme [Kiritimatiellia bacterium]